jgi:hypothetical protein
MKFFAIILLLLLKLSAHSQGPINIGIKYGTNSSTMSTNIDEVLVQNINESNINNYLAGAFIRINAGRIYAQPEAYFNTKGGIISPVGENEYQIPTKTNFNYQTIDVPVVIGYKIIDRSLINLRLHGGPVFSYVTSNSLYSEITNLRSSDLSKRYIGWQIGLGIDIWFITIDGRIENSSNVLITESPFSAINQAYLLSVGIKLF